MATTAIKNGASNGNVLQRCVSLANGALSPDQRVNYEFGLVLGVDDFRQEQLYFLARDTLHNRSLHGYGTVAGLDVIADRPADSTREMLVTVTPGMAVDQFGRTIALRDEQCARLGAWYARQVQDGTAPPAADETGRLRAYVVAAYDECLDALVPIPGQPCSSSDTLMAPSRIRDSFRFEIRWSPPPMTAWDADRAFADLLALVRFEAGLPAEASDEAELITRVRALAAPPVMEMCAPAAAPEAAPPVVRLPREGGRATLDRIFAVWVTEVRPAIVGQADLIDPALSNSVDPAVLLSCIDFLPAAGFDSADPEIAEATVSDIGRPFLLHTQLIQELLLLGGGDATALKAIRSFATLEVRGPKTLWLWLHHGQPLDFVGAATDALQLAGDGAALAIASVQPVAGFDNLYELATGEGAANDVTAGMHLALQMALGSLQERGGDLLPVVLADAGYDYLGRDGENLVVFAVVATVPPSRDLATVTARTLATGQIVLDLWFHTDEAVTLPAQVLVQRGQDGSNFNFNTAANSGTTPAFQWTLTPPGNIRLRAGEPLILNFETASVQFGDGTTLADRIRRERVGLVGFDGGALVRVYHQIALPATAQGPNIDDLITELAMRLPTQPFVTINAALQRTIPLFELWFHLDRRFEKADTVIFPDIPRFVIFTERPNRGNSPSLPPDLREVPRDAISIKAIQSNAYQVTIQAGVWADVASPYVRFAFPVADNIIVAGGQNMPLEEFIKAARIKFEGHNGEDAIVAFVRIPGQAVIG